jgi:hypothetical protein
MGFDARAEMSRTTIWPFTIFAARVWDLAIFCSLVPIVFVVSARIIVW